MHIILATTRFKNSTWEQNCKWRRDNSWEGCIYGSPTRINDNIPTNALMFILEMNNDTNMVLGVGLITNHLVSNQRYKIYEWGNYNRFVYKSQYRIDRRDMLIEEEAIITLFDTLLFTGYGHLKRGHGITCVPEKIYNKQIDFVEKIRTMFISRFQSRCK
jgi:hypothetical protein